jgi:predicted dehydrogenase
MALAALSAGKTVYLEKPLAITISDCDLILEEAMKTGNKLYIGHNLRFFPVVAKMKEIIDSGIIGKVKTCWCRHFVNYGGDAYFKDWHSERKNIYGLLLQKGAHDIDAIHYLMGAYSSSVNGMGMLSVYDKCRRRVPGEPAPAEWVQDDNLYPPEDVEGFSPVIDVEDHNMIMMQLANGAQACYMQSHYAPDNERNYAIIGTRGRLENIGDAANAEIHVWTRRGKRSEPDIVYSVPAKAGSHSGADPLIMRNFIDFAAGRALAITSPVAAREAVAAGFLAHESMRGDGGLRKIPALAQDIIDYFTNGIYPEL